jgi:hypothetical protein
MAGTSLPSLFCLIFPMRRENDNVFDDFFILCQELSQGGGNFAS